MFIITNRLSPHFLWIIKDCVSDNKNVKNVFFCLFFFENYLHFKNIRDGNTMFLLGLLANTHKHVSSHEPIPHCPPEIHTGRDTHCHTHINMHL